MPKLGKRMMEVNAASGCCEKPNCCTGSFELHRHHRRHQALWIGVWQWRARGAEEKFLAFRDRYYSFNREDWSRLCAHHHAEIHLVYDQIIRKDKQIVRRSLSRYSWPQAERLMDKLESVCLEWLKKETPGVTSERLNELRERYYTRPRRGTQIPIEYYILND